MTNEELKKYLNHTAANSELIEFLYGRLVDENYRGVQISQHNRYDLNDIINILTILSKKGYMEILVGDDEGNYDSSVMDYVDFCNQVKNINGKGTPNSIKKNLFPDLNRMGFINRFDKNNQEISPYDGCGHGIKYVEISELGTKLINTPNLKDRYFIFCRAIEKISAGFLHKLKEMIVELGLEKIKDVDLTLIFSGLDQTFSNKTYGYDEILKLAQYWFKLTRIQRSAIVKIISSWANERKNIRPKNFARDFGNWVNESEQIIKLFSQTPIFEATPSNNELWIKFGHATSMYENLADAKRSILEKHKYLEIHKIVSKYAHFRLHHIIPLYEAETIDEYKMLDCWENMIYINADTHATIHSKDKYKLFEISFEGDNLIFTSVLDQSIFIKAFNEQNVKYNVNLKEKLCLKNKQLLSLL